MHLFNHPLVNNNNNSHKILKIHYFSLNIEHKKIIKSYLVVLFHKAVNLD